MRLIKLIHLINSNYACSHIVSNNKIIVMSNLRNNFFAAIILISIAGCNTKKESVNIVESPSSNIAIEFILSNDGSPNYIVKHKSSVVIDTSKMGFDFKEQRSLQSGLKIIGIETNTVNEDWEMQWGEQRVVNNNYNEMIVKLEEEQAPNRKLNISFRAYNYGIGFRYEFPEQKGVDTLIIMDENTQFN